MAGKQRGATHVVTAVALVAVPGHPAGADASVGIRVDARDEAVGQHGLAGFGGLAMMGSGVRHVVETAVFGFSKLEEGLDLFMIGVEFYSWRTENDAGWMIAKL